MRKFRSHSESLLDAFVGLRLNYALLKPLLGDLDQPIPHVHSDGLRSGLPALRITLITVGVLDAVKLSWDKDPRTRTLRNIMAALDEETIRNALRVDLEHIDVIHAGGDAEEHLAAVKFIESKKASENAGERMLRKGTYGSSSDGNASTRYPAKTASFHFVIDRSLTFSSVSWETPTSRLTSTALAYAGAP